MASGTELAAFNGGRDRHRTAVVAGAADQSRTNDEHEDESTDEFDGQTAQLSHAVSGQRASEQAAGIGRSDGTEHRRRTQRTCAYPTIVNSLDPSLFRA